MQVRMRNTAKRLASVRKPAPPHCRPTAAAPRKPPPPSHTTTTLTPGQDLQPVCLSEFWYFPEGQPVHALAPALEYFPGPQ